MKTLLFLGLFCLGSSVVRAQQPAPKVNTDSLDQAIVKISGQISETAAKLRTSKTQGDAANHTLTDQLSRIDSLSGELETALAKRYGSQYLTAKHYEQRQRMFMRNMFMADTSMNFDFDFDFDFSQPSIPPMPPVPETYWNGDSTIRIQDEIIISGRDTTKRKKIIMSDDKIIIDMSDAEDTKACGDEDTASAPRKPKTLTADFFRLDLGRTMLLHDGDTRLPVEQSDFQQGQAGLFTHTRFYPVNVGLNLVKGQLYLSGSLGFEWINYHFKNNIRPTVADGKLVPVNEGVEYKRNKLLFTYFNTPVMLHYQTGKKARTNFEIGIGAYNSFLIGQSLRQKDTEGNKEVVRDDYQANFQNYGITGEIGIAGVKLYGSYALTPLFQEGAGPEVSPVSVGVTFFGDLSF